MTALPVKKEKEKNKDQPKRWIDVNLADVKQIMAIHRYRRPDNSISENAFIERFILPMSGLQKDKYGNIYKLVGDKHPKILWSCHTDTVHRTAGIQEVSMYGPKGSGYSKKLALASEEKTSNCLGADDGAGIWMLLELIKANVPGIYVFHRNEEHGCKGSEFVLKNHWDVLEGVDAAIAFDRRGRKDIITHQCSVRTASDEFARSLAAGLKMDHVPSDGGVYTDTHIYKGVIPECTNIAAGYDGAHGQHEHLDMEYLINLRNAVLKLDLNSLVIARDPTKIERKGYYHNNTSSWDGGQKYDKYQPSWEPTTLPAYLRRYAEDVADMLETWNIDLDAIKKFVADYKAEKAADKSPNVPATVTSATTATTVAEAKKDAKVGEETEKDESGDTDLCGRSNCPQWVDGSPCCLDDTKSLPTQLALEQGD